MAKKSKSFVTEKSFNKEIKNMYQHYYVYNIFSIINDDNSKVDNNESKNKVVLKSRLLNRFDEKQLSKRSELELDIRDYHFNIFHDLFFYRFVSLEIDYSGQERSISNKMLLYLAQVFSQKNGTEFTSNSLRKGINDNIAFTVENTEATNKELLEMSVIHLVKETKNASTIFRLSDFTMKKLLGSMTKDLSEKDKNKTVRRFVKYLTFATEFYDFGELGKELLYRLENITEHFSKITYSNPKDTSSIMLDTFKYKHNYIARCLNDYNLIDIMYCIKNGNEFQEYTLVNGTKLLAMPLKIFTNYLNGKQYVTLFLPEYRSICNVNVSDIDIIVPIDISFDKNEATVDEDMKTAIAFVNDKTYEIIPDCYKGNLVKDSEWFLTEKSAEVILYIPEDKKYKVKSLEKEYGSNFARLDDTTYSVKLFYLHNDEVMPKLRKVYGFIKDIKSDDNLLSIVKDDFSKLWSVYNTRKTEAKRLEKSDEVNEKLLELSYETVTQKMPHSLLFSQYFSKTFRDFLCTLSKINMYKNVYCFADEIDLEVKKMSRSDKSDFRKKHPDYRHLKDVISEVVENDWLYEIDFVGEEIGFDNKNIKEYRINKLYEMLIVCSYFQSVLDYNDCNEDIIYSVKCKNTNTSTDFYYDRFPITKLEAMWLKWVLSDSYADLFFEKDEKERIIDIITSHIDISDNVFESVKNHKIGVNDNPLLPKDIFQKILHDTERHQNIKIDYSGKLIKNLIPKYIEFSAKDNQIWLVTNQNSFLLNKVNRVDYMEESKNLKFSSEKGAIERIPVYITILNDTLEFKNKFLSEFAPWKKNYAETIKGKNTGQGNFYNVPNKVYIYFYKREENEIYNRLLSYGADIRIENADRKNKKAMYPNSFLKNLLSDQNILFAEYIDKQ